MEISNLSIQDLFGNKKNSLDNKSRNRTYSDTKGFNQRKKLARI